MVKNLPANAGATGDVGSIPGLGRSPGAGHGNLLLPGESHGQRSLAGFSPWNFLVKNTGMSRHFSSPEDLPDPGIEPTSLVSPALACGFFTNCTTWEAT